MLPEFEVFESISSVKLSVAAEPSRGSAAADFSKLLPSLSSFRSQVAKVAMLQRQVEQASQSSFAVPSVSAQGESAFAWGDRRNGRLFCLQADGSASYEFRSGETLRSVVQDLLSECKKIDAEIVIDFLSIRAASNQILSFNRIADADLISAGAQITIPSHLVPKRKFAA